MTENGELHNWTTFAITMIIALRLKYEDNSASPASNLRQSRQRRLAESLCSYLRWRRFMTSDRLDQLEIGVCLSQTRTDRPSAYYVTAPYCILNELVPSQEPLRSFDVSETAETSTLAHSHSPAIVTKD